MAATIASPCSFICISLAVPHPASSSSRSQTHSSLISFSGFSQDLKLSCGLNNSRQSLLRNSGMQSVSENGTAAPHAAASPSLQAAEAQKEAAELVQEFYAAINRREIDSIGTLFAEDCVYEDLVFPKPFLGRKVRFFLFVRVHFSVGDHTSM